MSEQGAQTHKDQFKSFFREFVKEHGLDSNLAPEKILPGVIRVFEQARGVKIDLDATETRELERLAALNSDAARVGVAIEAGDTPDDVMDKIHGAALKEGKERKLAKETEELKDEVEKILAHDQPQLEQLVQKILVLEEEARKELGDDHPLIKDVSRLLGEIQGKIEKMKEETSRQEAKAQAKVEEEKAAEELFTKIVGFETEIGQQMEGLDSAAIKQWRERIKQEFEEPYTELLRRNKDVLSPEEKETAKMTFEECLVMLRQKEIEPTGAPLPEEEVYAPPPTTFTPSVDASEINRLADEASSQHMDEVIKNLKQEQGRTEQESAERIEQLKQRLADLQTKLSNAFVEKEKKSGLFGRIFGKKQKAEAEYERCLEEYKLVKEQLVRETEMRLADAMQFLQEQEKGVRARIKEKYQGEKENFVSKIWRKMGDCNIYNLFEKKAKESPDSWWAREFKKWGVAGKVGGKMLSLRFGVSMGLAGLGILGPGMATQSEAFILSRSGMVGLGSGFGSRGVMDRVGQWAGEKKLKKVKEAEELGDAPEEQYGKLSELIGEYEGYTFVNKVDLSKNEDYARLVQLREQVGAKLLEKKRETIGAENVNELLKFLNNQEADGLEKLTQKIGSAKTKRWIKRGISVTLGTALGVFTNVCLTAKAAHEQASQAYFAWVEGKQKALEAVSEAQAHAQHGVESAGVAPIDTAPATHVAPQHVSSVSHEVAATPRPQTSSGAGKAVEAAVANRVAVSAETPRFGVDLNNLEFKELAQKLHLSEAGKDYMAAMVKKFPELNDPDTLERIWKAGEMGNHGWLKHDGIYDAVRNFDTNIKTAGAFKFEAFQSILDKGGVDKAVDYLKLFKLNEHSLSNLGIEHADEYSDAKLADKIREIVAAYKNNGDTKAGRHIFEALRHHENRFIGSHPLPVKGVARGLQVRTLGANEFTGDKQIIVEQAKGMRAMRLPEVQDAPVKPQEAVEAVQPKDIGITDDMPVRVEGKLPEGVEAGDFKVKNVVEIAPYENNQTAFVVLDDGRTYLAGIDVADGDVVLSNLTSSGGKEELLRGLAGAAKDEDLAEMAKFYPGSSKADLARGVIEHTRGSTGGGGGGGVVQTVEAGKYSGGVGRVLITPEVVPGKTVPSGGGHAVSEHIRPRGAKVINADIKPESPAAPAPKAAPQEVERATPETADKNVAKLYEQPAGAPSELLPDTASFDDMEKAIDDMDWSHADMKKAKIFVRFMEMQQKLLDDNASGLRKMLADIVGDNVDTEAGNGWITRKVLGLLSRQKNVSDMIVNGINKNRSIAEIQKQLAQEMFVYDQAARAAQAGVLPDAHNPNNLADYNRYAHAVLAREFDDSNVEMEALLQQTQAVGKHGGAASK